MRTNHTAFGQPRAARLTPLAAAFALVLSPTAFGAALVVNTNDSGAGSLRQAITDANGACGGDPTVGFNIPGTGPFVISPSSPLPTLYCAEIKGYTQPGATANASATGFTPTLKVTLDGGTLSYGCGLSGTNAGYGPPLISGLTIQNFESGICGTAKIVGNAIRTNVIGADLDYGSVVGGAPLADRNIFVNNSSYGLLLRGGDAYVENNFIGTANGSTAAPNGKGIFVYGSGGFITDNVISGNTSLGVYVENDYGGTQIINNRIGVNAAKTGKIANAGGGIFLSGGGDLDINDNLISGNGVFGIAFEYSYDLNISNNVIGLSYGGAPLANTGPGIEAFCGGYVSITGNVIASNQAEGISLDGVVGSSIESNTIRDNASSGVRIVPGSCYGGDNFLVDNVITGNKVDGVQLTGATTGNSMHANSIHGNTRKNINLSGSSTLPNDPGDGDGNANNQQNYPVIDDVVTDNGTGDTTIYFSLDSIDNTSFKVEFYANDAAGDPAGKTFIREETVFVYGGVYFGSTSVSGIYSHISATATNLSTYDTSEFSPQKAAVSAPAAVVTPSNVDFGDVTVNTESVARTVTIRSIGDQPYVIDSIDSYGGFCYGGLDQAASVAPAAPSICDSGAFICETTCDTGTPYSKGQLCRVTAKFAPSFTGYESTSLFICDNTSITPKEIYFEGNGIPPPPITVSPRSWDFGAVPIGESGVPHKFVVSNVGYGSLDLVSLATTGEYDVVSSTCGSFLYGGSSCDVAVNFLPTISGDSPGAFVATYSSYGQLDAGVAAAPIAPTLYKAGATLSGTGIGGGQLTLPERIELGAAVVGGDPVSRTVELRNSGTQPVNIASITIAGPFTMVNTCTAPLAPDATCTVTISFTAPSIGDFNGSFTVVSDADGGSGEVSVHATGQIVAAPLLQIAPSSIGFGDRVIGSQTGAQTITITNVGGVAATLSLSTSSLDFLIAGNTCGTTLEPQASCSALVAFRPVLGFGPRSGSFIVSSNAHNSPQAVGLGGTGCRPYVGAGNRSGEGASTNCAP